MITREQVADLQPGDVVELTSTAWLGGAVRGRLEYDGQYESLVLRTPGGGEAYVIRNAQGHPSCADERSLTVVSRAPRPLYVNSDRTEPVPGDVVRDADDEDSRQTWLNADDADPGWFHATLGFSGRRHLPPRLRLLVDGETGRCVQ